jgi:hypothetical protein
MNFVMKQRIKFIMAALWVLVGIYMIAVALAHAANRMSNPYQQSEMMVNLAVSFLIMLINCMLIILNKFADWFQLIAYLVFAMSLTCWLVFMGWSSAGNTSVIPLYATIAGSTTIGVGLAFVRRSRIPTRKEKDKRKNDEIAEPEI